MTTLALYSIKGGVGKTAAAVNLSYLAAQSGAQTLVCDLDPQSSATFYFRVKPKLKRRARGFVRGGNRIEQSIKGTDYENLDLLPADFSHRNLDVVYDRLKRSTHRLSKVIDSLKDEYDLIIIDSPPTINILAENIFNAADHILVPIVPTTLSVRTHGHFLSFLKENGYDDGSVYAFLSMVDGRKKMHHELSATVLKEFKRVLHTPIPYLSLIERMGVRREPVPAFAPQSDASKAYQKLWGEIEQTILSSVLRHARRP